MKPARTRRPPPPYLTSGYSETSKNPPSSPSLLNLSLQWSQQEPAVLPLPTQPQPTVKPARTRRPTSPQPTVNPARTRRPTHPQPTVKPARTCHPTQPQPKVKAVNPPPHLPPVLHNFSLKWSQQEPTILSLQWSQKEPATSPPSLFS